MPTIGHSSRSTSTNARRKNSTAWLKPWKSSLHPCFIHPERTEKSATDPLPAGQKGSVPPPCLIHQKGEPKSRNPLILLHFQYGARRGIRTPDPLHVTAGYCLVLLNKRIYDEFMRSNPLLLLFYSNRSKVSNLAAEQHATDFVRQIAV